MADLVVVRKVELAVPVERAWQLVTMPEHVRKWYAFGGAEIDATPRGAITFRWVEHGMYRGIVDEVDEPKRYVYRLAQLEDVAPAPGNSTTVELTFEPSAEGTLLRVAERGFESLALPGASAKDMAIASAEAWAAGFTELRSLALAHG